jgi:ketosteroid isomerase-like protein
MKRSLLSTIAVIALWCLAAQAQNAKSSSVADEIKKLEQQRNEAILKGDTATLDKLTSDDYANTTAQGKIEKKAEILDGFKSGKIKFDSRELSDLDVRVYGNTAVVTGQVNQKSTNNGADTSGQNRFTRVYVKQNGRWVSVANQATPIPK